MISDNSQITNYGYWELIDKCFVSPDKTKLLVYHKSDKSKVFFLTLYDIKTKEIISEIKPGWYCSNILWTEDYIIYEWRTSGGGTRLDYYTYLLEFINEINSYHFFFDIESNIVIGLPIYSAEDGIIDIYQFDNGKLIKSISFVNELCGNYVCNEIKKIEPYKYKVILKMIETDLIVDKEIAL
jgi:WD40 repeat protein